MMRRFRIQVLGLVVGVLLIFTLTQVKNFQPINNSLKSEHGAYIIKSNDYELLNDKEVLKPADAIYITTSEGYEVEISNNQNEPYILQDTSKSEDGTYIRENYYTGSSKIIDESFDSLDTTKYLFDSSRLYLWRGFVKTGSAWKEVSSKWQVCLATHASVEHLFWLAHQTKLWKGPISVSVYVPGTDYTVAVHMINYLQQCFTQVQELTSFHFLYPKKAPPELKDIKYDLNLDSCQDPESFNRFLVDNLRDTDLKNFLINTSYPQNLVRNIARHGCPCIYAMTPDMDMLAIEGMSEELNQFLMKPEVQSCDKCAYVIPVYEISKNVTKNPRNKAELLQMLNKNLAGQFHVKVFKPNQENSDLKKWESLDTNLGFDVAYNISNYRNYWEPIYVAKANIPPFNERFIGYGWTRNSQVYEMQLSGYHWKMLTKAFFCHRGFQTTGNYSVQRKYQVKENRERFLVFRKEMLLHYNKSWEQYPLHPSPSNAALPLKIKKKVKVKVNKTVNKTIGYVKPVENKRPISLSTKDDSKVFINGVLV